MKLVKSYQTPDGKIFQTLHDAKVSELQVLVDQICGVEVPVDKRAEIAEALVGDGEVVMAILKQRERKQRASKKSTAPKPVKRDRVKTPEPATSPEPENNSKKKLAHPA